MREERTIGRGAMVRYVLPCSYVAILIPGHSAPIRDVAMF